MTIRRLLALAHNGVARAECDIDGQWAISIWQAARASFGIPPTTATPGSNCPLICVISGSA